MVHFFMFHAIIMHTQLKKNKRNLNECWPNCVQEFQKFLYLKQSINQSINCFLTLFVPPLLVPLLVPITALPMHSASFAVQNYPNRTLKGRAVLYSFMGKFDASPNQMIHWCARPNKTITRLLKVYNFEHLFCLVLGYDKKFFILLLPPPPHPLSSKDKCFVGYCSPSGKFHAYIVLYWPTPQKRKKKTLTGRGQNMECLFSNLMHPWYCHLVLKIIFIWCLWTGFFPERKRNQWFVMLNTKLFTFSDVYVNTYYLCTMIPEHGCIHVCFPAWTTLLEIYKKEN